tara:strand:+ start:2520 stop:3257 length:738 start_codon:yes stop_codon:yes gene_type:complete
MESIIDLLKSHTSIRKFKDQPIEESLLLSLIEAGQGAATSSFLQGTTVIRIQNMETRRQIADLCGGQKYVENAAEFLIFCADLKRSKNCCDKHEVEFEGDYTEQFIIATVDVALMAQSMVAASESCGIGICYIGAIRNDPQTVTELLNLPKHVYPVFGLCLGYPDQAPEIKPRLPLKVVLKNEVYEDSQDKAFIDDYDAKVEEYYRTRSGGGHGTSWTAQIAGLLSTKSRPHMKDFLAKQGFKFK